MQLLEELKLVYDTVLKSLDSFDFIRPRNPSSGTIVISFYTSGVTHKRMDRVGSILQHVHHLLPSMWQQEIASKIHGSYPIDKDSPAADELTDSHEPNQQTGMQVSQFLVLVDRADHQ